SSECSNDQGSREAFCCISSADVATPPQLAALPGAYSVGEPCRRATASGVVGMLAPSATATTPLLISVLALSAVNSFWVAQGRASVPGTSQTLPPAMKRALPPRCSA